MLQRLRLIATAAAFLIALSTLIYLVADARKRPAPTVPVRSIAVDLRGQYQKAREQFTSAVAVYEQEIAGVRTELLRTPDDPETLGRYSRLARAQRSGVVGIEPPVTLFQPASLAANSLERGASEAEVRAAQIRGGTPMSEAQKSTFRAILITQANRMENLRRALERSPVP